MPISYKHKIYTTLGTPTALSGNVVSATDSAGVPVKDYTINGKTIVWNQLLDKSKYPATTTQNGVTFTNNGDGTIIVNGTATANAIFAPINMSNPISIVSGHKFLFTSCPSGGSSNTYFSDLKKVPEDDTFYDFGVGVIATTTSTTTGLRFNIRVVSGYAANNLVFKPQLFDLTQMFGAGNEPATPAEFRAMFPDDYYPYNVGELKSIVPTSVEASTAERFQLLDKSKFTATTTINGVTFTNNGDGTITYNGTTTGANYILQSGLKVVAGHKYFSYVGENTKNKIGVLLYALPDPYNTFDSRFPAAGGGISTALKDSNQLYYQPKPLRNISYSNFILKPQFFDLTEMFGAGNEPTTPAEFWQRVPEKLYGHNPNDYRAANIPSSKYFPDGMRSAGSAYDEINFLSQKAIKRVGVRPYQAGDENNTGFITDKKNTVYALSTPVETAITPPLQALPTYKGFTSFSAPNSLTQNGPLSVTYYAEGGTNPENGWLTSYRRKLYMGRNIEWNQLMDKSKYPATTTTNGVTFTNSGDGTIIVNGTGGSNGVYYTFVPPAVESGHKYMLYGCPTGGSSRTYCIVDTIYKSGSYAGSFSDLGSGAISRALEEGEKVTSNIFIGGGYTANNLIFKPQLFDLTQMFGAGNEPATPAEFWSYFDHKLYPYNTGETQPLFKISRKSQWGSNI